jgi:DNA-binding response OmpR family regulator
MSKILIVEDEQPLLKVLADKFNEENEEVITARNGQEGLASALENHPDLILLDLKMPVMGGNDMLAKLRQDAWGVDVPVIILSNLNDSTSISDSMNNKITKYFVKSDWKLEDVVQAVKEMLDLIKNSSN